MRTLIEILASLAILANAALTSVPRLMTSGGTDHGV